MSCFVPSPPFACHPLLKEISDERRRRLVKEAEDAGVTVWNYDDAVGLETDDGEDDLWISERDLADAPEPFGAWVAERLAERDSLSGHRNRVLRVLEHALAAVDVRLLRSRTGLWFVERQDEQSWTCEVGATLTQDIWSTSPQKALQGMLRSMNAHLLLRHRDRKKILATFRGLVDEELHHNPGTRMRGDEAGPDTLDWTTLSRLLEVEVEPTVKPWRQPADQEVLEDDGGGAWLGLPSWEALPELPEDRLDQFAEAVFLEYHRSIENSALNCRIDAPWLLSGDTWTDLDRNLDCAASLVEESRADGQGRSFWTRLAAWDLLLHHGRIEHRADCLREIDAWWRHGGHDIQDWNELTSLFPNHPAGQRIRHGYAGEVWVRESLIADLAARRYFREQALREFESLAQVRRRPKADWPNVVWDLLECLRAAGQDWASRVLPNAETRFGEAKKATARLLELDGPDLLFAFDEVVAVAGEFGWRDCQDLAMEHRDLLGLLLWHSLGLLEQHPAPADLLQLKLSSAREALDSLPPHGIPRGKFESFIFDGRVLLDLARVGPCPRLRLVAGNLLLLCASQKTRSDDQLAAAIVWHRCRHLA